MGEGWGRREEGGTRNQTERTTLDLFLKSIYIFHLHACLLHVYLTTEEEVLTIYYIHIYIYNPPTPNMGKIIDMQVQVRQEFQRTQLICHVN